MAKCRECEQEYNQYKNEVVVYKNRTTTMRFCSLPCTANYVNRKEKHKGANNDKQ